MLMVEYFLSSTSLKYPMLPLASLPHICCTTDTASVCVEREAGKVWWKRRGGGGREEEGGGGGGREEGEEEEKRREVEEKGGGGRGEEEEERREEEEGIRQYSNCSQHDNAHLESWNFSQVFTAKKTSDSSTRP